VSNLFGRSLLSIGTLSLGIVASLVDSPPAFAQANTPASAVSFSDVESIYWARPFIEALATSNIISGYPDKTFRPNQPVNRAEFAAMIQKAFDQRPIRELEANRFSDVPANYWAAPAIQEAYESGFMVGYPGNRFLPSQQIPKAQVLVSLASGLGYSPSRPPATTLTLYTDAGQVPPYAVNGIAAATEKRLVVNYPDLKFLNPTETATRGAVAAYLYQALVSKGKLQPLTKAMAVSQYIANSPPERGPATPGVTTNPSPPKPEFKVFKETKIKIKSLSAGSDRIIVAPGETVQVTLEVADDVKNLKREVLIPIASQVEGRLVPTSVGSQPGVQFVAQKLTIGSQTYRINATSEPIAVTRTVSRITIRGGVATDAAKQALRRILGSNTNLGSTLSTPFPGKLITPPTNTSPASVIVINAQDDLLLTLQSDLGD